MQDRWDRGAFADPAERFGGGAAVFRCGSGQHPQELGHGLAVAPNADGVSRHLADGTVSASESLPDEFAGVRVVDPAGGPDGVPPRLYFHRREKSKPASYPIHLDFGTEGREAEIERLTQAGASVVETKQGTNLTFAVMRDPEGNPFCVG